MKTYTVTDDEFIELISSRKDRLYKIALSYMKDHNDALEVVQEATCKAYIKKSSLRHPEYFNTWFIRILINTAINMLRSNKKYVALSNEEELSEEQWIDEDNYDLWKALDKLDMKYRNIIVLKFYEDMTFKEIAQVLKKPESTIKTNYYRAINVLKGELKDERIEKQ